MLHAVALSYNKINQNWWTAALTLSWSTYFPHYNSCGDFNSNVTAKQTANISTSPKKYQKLYGATLVSFLIEISANLT